MATSYIYYGQAVAAAGTNFRSERGRNLFPARAHCCLPVIGGDARGRTGPFAVDGRDDIFCYSGAYSRAVGDFSPRRRTFETNVHSTLKEVRLGGEVFYSERMQAVLQSSRPKGEYKQETAINFYYEMEILICGEPIRLIYHEDLLEICTGREAAAYGQKESRSRSPRVKHLHNDYYMYSPVREIEWANGDGPDGVKFHKNMIYVEDYGEIYLVEVLRGDHRFRASLARAVLYPQALEKYGLRPAGLSKRGDAENSEVIICEVGSNGMEPPP
ncbi:MAG: hypothetical protein QNK37_08805 [Acidobacteriota bacterium]|nr:hypothetical protein [Acidobacteriota bacterium]